MLDHSLLQQVLTDAELEQQASVNGKYRTLLKKIKIPQDVASYGKFHDYGPYTGTMWAGYKDLPVGSWVYVYPYWYIWTERH